MEEFGGWDGKISFLCVVFPKITLKNQLLHLSNQIFSFYLIHKLYSDRQTLGPKSSCIILSPVDLLLNTRIRPKRCNVPSVTLFHYMSLLCYLFHSGDSSCWFAEVNCHIGNVHMSRSSKMLLEAENDLQLTAKKKSNTYSLATRKWFLPRTWIFLEVDSP